MFKGKTRQASPIAIQKARELLDVLCVDSPEHIDVEKIAINLGAMVVYRELRVEQGRLIRTRGRKSAVLVVRRDLQGTPQARFVIAHEIGHMRCHPQLDQFKLCSSRDMSDYWSDGVEAEANQFAAELLMPRRLFQLDCDISHPSLHAVGVLAKKYGTSLMATGIQFVHYAPEKCALVFSRAGVVVWVKKHAEFGCYIGRGHRLLPGNEGSYAADLHAGRTAPDHPMPVTADCWTDSEWAQGRDFWEHSLCWHDGPTTCVLTLLRRRD
jgi:hypothetical protein